MFEEPEEQPAETATDPAARAKEKSDELRCHAELAAVFEGVRKFDAALLPGLDATAAREIQRGFGKLDKARSTDSPVLPELAGKEAMELLTGAEHRGLSTNDYHIHRRPGEVMIVRWLVGEEVEAYWTRLQAHFDVSMGRVQGRRTASQRVATGCENSGVPESAGRDRSENVRPVPAGRDSGSQVIGPVDANR